MVVGSLGLQFVAVTNENFTECASISNDLLSVRLPCRRRPLEERGRNGGDSIVVWATLARGEDGVIDALFEVFGIFDVLAEEYEACSRSAESFVSSVFSQGGTAAAKDALT
jgi:hypothetical protein